MDVFAVLNGSAKERPRIERYWGEETERSRREFPDGAADEAMPGEIIRAFGILKKAAARVNFALLPEQMSEEKCAAIFSAADEVIRGRLADEFPLAVWQTGSGAKTNVNVNEVVARRGSEMADDELLSPEDVNLSQPPSGAFPAAAHIAAALALEQRLLPAAQALADALGQDADDADAARWHAVVARDRAAVCDAMRGLFTLTLDGADTPAPEGFADALAKDVAEQTGHPFVPATHDGGRLDGLLAAHGAIKAFASDLMALADELRRAEQAPEADSDLTPCERIEIAAVQVMGNDAALGFAAAQDEAEADEFLPVCAYNFLQSARLLGESVFLLAASLAPAEESEDEA